MWQIKNVLSPLPQCQCSPNLWEWCLTIKESHDPLITWCCKITWQTKKSMYPLSQCLPLPYLEGWLLTLKGCYWYSHMILQSHDFVWSPEKLIPCVFYHSTYGQQTWQVGDISWGAPTHKVTSFFNHAIWWGQMTKLNTIHLHLHLH